MSEGEILAGKYRIEQVLGAGGMGVVVAARHIELDEKVAIKFLLGPMLADATAVARFQREAKAAVRIKNEHVVRVFDVGRLDDGAPYMVMEFLEGKDLSQWLQQHGALPVPQAVDFVVQACVALADAHAIGIIHRDLKPANLFCVRRSDGQFSIKVLDFGISKLMQAPGEGMSFTQTNAMIGSPLYMSPEQFRSSKNVDGRTDIWALGAILFELVTARPPFDAGSVTELAIKIATEPPPLASLARHDVPPPLATVIAKCLEREPERRPQNVAELAVALAPFTSPAGRALVERVVGIVGKYEPGVPSVAPVQERLSQPEGRTAPALHWTASGAPRRRSWALTLGVLGVTGVAAAGGVIWWRTERAPVVTPEGASAGVALAPPPSTVAPAAAATANPASTVTSVGPPIVAPIPASSTNASPTVALDPSERTPRDRRKRAPAPAPTSKPTPAATAASPARAAAATPSPAPSPAPHDNCDPPFFFDSHGNRVFKQECL